MPLGRFLKILLGALFALAVVFVVAVQYSGIQPASDIQNFAAYGQLAKEYLNYDACTLVTRTIEWFRGLSHDDWLAASTVAIAAFTLALWHSTRQQGRITNAALNLAREEFNATHRPELIVREVNLTWEGETNPIEVIAFTIANRGNAPCTIIESRFEYLPRVGGGQALLTNGKNELGNLKFETGEVHRFAWSLPNGMKSSIFDDHYFRGTIIYTDSANVRRRYVIARFQKRETEGFFRTKNPEDEYTD